MIPPEHIRGTGRVLIAFTLDEMEELAFATASDAVRLRLATAIGLLDHRRQRIVLDHHEEITRSDG
jgi:hypothetical protein